MLKSQNAKPIVVFLKTYTSLLLAASDSAPSGLRGIFSGDGRSVGLLLLCAGRVYGDDIAVGDLGVCQSQQVTSALW